MAGVICAMLIGCLVLAGCAQPAPDPAGPLTVRAAVLKGPTAMGLAGLIADPGSYLGDSLTASFAVEGTADAISPKLLGGDLDIALLPSNLAAILHARSSGAVQVAAIDALNVLYVVAKGVDIASIDDLAGRTVYSTGLGTTPQAVLEVVLAAHGLTGQVNVQYLSEATEVAAKLAAADSGIAVLPQPYVTVVTKRDPATRVAVDLGAEFQAATGSPVVTGVTVVRRDFAAAHPEAVAAFLNASARSTAFTLASPVEAGQMIADLGIADAGVASAAIPYCGLTAVSGADVAEKLSGYLATLHDFKPELVGGALPGDDFYWVG